MRYKCRGSFKKTLFLKTTPNKQTGPNDRFAFGASAVLFVCRSSIGGCHILKRSLRKARCSSSGATGFSLPVTLPPLKRAAAARQGVLKK